MGMVLSYPKDCCKLQQSKIFVGVILKMVEKNADKWLFWINPEFEILATRKTTRAIATEQDTHSTMKGINVQDMTEFKRKATLRNKIFLV